MRAVIYLCSVIALAILPACSDDPGQPPPEGPSDLILPLGGSAVAPGTSIRVTFAEVLEDSRCPIDVTCFRAGNGQVLITAREGNGDEDGRLILNTTEGPRTGTFGGWRFELTELDPEPHTGRHTPPDYRVTLRVSSK
jgi:hypothetical protein